MPSVPKFNVHQDDKMIYVDINVPYVRVSDMEFHIDGCEFTFWCKPYLLKLNFPYEIIEDERTKAVYDINLDNGTIHVHLSKKAENQHFPDLDLLTKLLVQKKWNPIDDGVLPAAPLIEVLESTTQHEEKDEIVSNDITVDQSLLSFETKEPALKLDQTQYYGFHDAYHNFFKCWHSEISEIISLPDPENTPQEQRSVLRIQQENETFNIERYLGDLKYLNQDPLFQDACAYEPYWDAIQRNRDMWYRKMNSLMRKNVSFHKLSPIPEEGCIIDRMDALQLEEPCEEDASSSQTITFSEKDKAVLRELPNKEYLIEKGSMAERKILCSMVDILIGYAYDHRMTQGESTIESSWTISILSPTLSWLDTNATSMEQVIHNGIRRMLTFPYVRHYYFSKIVLHDVLNILRMGKRCVLRSFLQIHRIFELSQTQYLLRHLYIRDYCVWLQHVEQDQLFESLADELELALQSHTKSQIGWDIDEIETWLDEEEESTEEESTDDEEESSDSE